MSRIVGCVGVGIMGSRMSQRLFKAGFQVVAHDLSPAALRAAVEHGIAAAPDLPSLAREAEVVILSLPMPSSVLAVVEGPDGLLAHVRPGAYICDASTVESLKNADVAITPLDTGHIALDCDVSPWTIPRLKRRGFPASTMVRTVMRP